MSEREEGGTEEGADGRRRRFLKYTVLVGLGVGGLGGLFTYSRRGPEEVSEPPDPLEPDESEPQTENEAEVPEVVQRYAPDLYFGALEKWYPTDPRRYRTASENGPVVDGLLALDEYSTAYTQADDPPDPTVFYRVVEAAAGVDAVQYWMYSVFDQFTVNFHWHDWELLQVFVDRESGDPILLSASAHSRGAPNNEFFEPDVSDGRRLGILSEVGSHSSASEVNEIVPSFERFSADDWTSDITNDILDVTTDTTAPFAYGLPRDEGARLPFVMPELEGFSLDEHPGLSVDRDDFIDKRVTVDSSFGLPTPPEDIPVRSPGLVLAAPDSPTGADATYRLESMDRVEETVEDFVGPQLSFEFAIPGFAEDQIAGHITSVGIPWEQQRYTDPLDDVTDPLHRRRIDGSEPSGLTSRVVGRVRQLRSGDAGDLDRVPDQIPAAFDNVAPVSLSDLPVECAVRLASESPEATVTQDGIFRYLRVEEGEHLLVANGPGYAPLAHRFEHDGGLSRAGAGGNLTVVANDDAGWIRGDGRDTSGIARVRVTESYAGTVYDGRSVGDDRFAVAVHREGTYTVDIVDAEGRRGAYRVDPESFGEDGQTRRDSIESGKLSLVRTLAEEIRETRELAERLTVSEESYNRVIERLSAAHEETGAAARGAEPGSAEGINERLQVVDSALAEALDILLNEEQRGYSDAAVAVLDPRIRALRERVEEAIETELAS